MKDELQWRDRGFICNMASLIEFVNLRFAKSKFATAHSKRGLNVLASEPMVEIRLVYVALGPVRELAASKWGGVYGSHCEARVLRYCVQSSSPSRVSQRFSVLASTPSLSQVAILAPPSCCSAQTT